MLWFAFSRVSGFPFPLQDGDGGSGGGLARHHCSSTQALQGPPCSTDYTMAATPRGPVVPGGFSPGPPCPWGRLTGKDLWLLGQAGTLHQTRRARPSGGASSDGEHPPTRSGRGPKAPQHPQRAGVLLQGRCKIGVIPVQAGIAGQVVPEPTSPWGLAREVPCVLGLQPPWGFCFCLYSARGCWGCKHQHELNWVVPKMSHFGSSFVGEEQGKGVMTNVLPSLGGDSGGSGMGWAAREVRS